MFTIEVEKREKNKNFNFGSVRRRAKVIHDDCHGGSVSWKNTSSFPGYWYFKCKRCGARTSVYRNEEMSKAKTAIVSTAIDGEERQITSEVRVVQRKTG